MDYGYKSCGNCGMPVSGYAEVGQRCPHCGVRWGYKDSKQYTRHIPSRKERLADYLHALKNTTNRYLSRAFSVAKCTLDMHEWGGCKCPLCGKTRDEGHNWSEDGEKCSKCGKENEVFDAVRRGDLARTEALLKGDPKLLFSTDRDHRTPLHLAAKMGHKDLAELLLANGAKVDVTDNHGRSTPLHLAAEMGHKDVAELLLANGAKIDVTDDHGRSTPLHLAAEMGHKDVVELLLANGANLNLRDYSSKRPSGRTPRDLAAEMGHKDVAELLLAKERSRQEKERSRQEIADVLKESQRCAMLNSLTAEERKDWDRYLKWYEDSVGTFGGNPRRTAWAGLQKKYPGLKKFSNSLFD